MAGSSSRTYDNNKQTQTLQNNTVNPQNRDNAELIQVHLKLSVLFQVNISDH